MRILLVEDDKNLGKALKDGLTIEGFDVDWVRDGQAAIYEVKATPYNAMVLDLGLPVKDGFDALKELRADGILTPILILSAQDGAESITKGLNLGGDDFVVKPVQLKVLVAKLNALIRRSEGLACNVLTIGSLQLNLDAHTVFLKNLPVNLSKKEFTLLQAFMISSNRVLTKAQLEEYLYNWGHEVESNAIEVHIHNLRKKLEPHFITTIRGVGYILKVDQ